MINEQLKTVKKSVTNLYVFVILPKYLQMQFQTNKDLLKRLILFFSFVFRHNDLPWNIRKFIHNKLNTVNFTSNLKTENPWGTSSWSHTDIGRLNQGLVGGQVSVLVTFMGRVGSSGSTFRSGWPSGSKNWSNQVRLTSKRVKMQIQPFNVLINQIWTIFGSSWILRV